MALKKYWFSKKQKRMRDALGGALTTIEVNGVPKEYTQVTEGDEMPSGWKDFVLVAEQGEDSIEGNSHSMSNDLLALLDNPENWKMVYRVPMRLWVKQLAAGTRISIDQGSQLVSDATNCILVSSTENDKRLISIDDLVHNYRTLSGARISRLNNNPDVNNGWSLVKEYLVDVPGVWAIQVPERYHDVCVICAGGSKLFVNQGLKRGDWGDILVSDAYPEFGFSGLLECSVIAYTDFMKYYAGALFMGDNHIEKGSSASQQVDNMTSERVVCAV